VDNDAFVAHNLRHYVNITDDGPNSFTMSIKIPARPLNRMRAWFGPPGCGKSTFIKLEGGFDLETLDSTDLRKEFVRRLPGLRDTSGLYQYHDIGAADLLPSDFDSEFFIRILVLPDRDLYVRRRAQRDSVHPEKASQPDRYEAFRAIRDQFDSVVKDFTFSSDHTPESVEPVQVETKVKRPRGRRGKNAEGFSQEIADWQAFTISKDRSVKKR
jgi:hypothetical protein